MWQLHTPRSDRTAWYHASHLSLRLRPIDMHPPTGKTDTLTEHGPHYVPMYLYAKTPSPANQICRLARHARSPLRGALLVTSTCWRCQPSGAQTKRLCLVITILSSDTPRCRDEQVIQPPTTNKLQAFPQLLLDASPPLLRAKTTRSHATKCFPLPRFGYYRWRPLV